MSITGVGSNPSVYATGSTGNSANAADYLKTLKEKYPKASITVASFDTPKAYEKYAYGGIGSLNNVAVSKNILEQMANDPQSAEKYEAYIKELTDTEEWAKQYTADNGGVLLARGVTIDKNGKVNFWSISKSTKTYGTDGPTFMERMQKDIDAKRTKQKDEELQQKKIDERQSLYGDRKAHFASAESVNKLAEKMSALSGEYNSVSNGGFDFKV